MFSILFKIESKHIDIVIIIIGFISVKLDFAGAVKIIKLISL